MEEIGLETWEEVNIIRRGKNYGYSEREGPQKLTVTADSKSVGNLPASDTLPVRLNDQQSLPGPLCRSIP